jgi:hypothetical protein
LIPNRQYFLQIFVTKIFYNHNIDPWTELTNVVCLSALDSWAFWLDQYQSQGFENVPQEKLLQLLDQSFRHLKPGTTTASPDGFFDTAWSYIPFVDHTKTPNCDYSKLAALVETPSRRLVLAKLIATSGGSEKLEFAEKILDQLIESDGFWYPAAHYYKAYILVNRTQGSILQNSISTENFSDKSSTSDFV